jgi:CHAT domain-containing protein
LFITKDVSYAWTSNQLRAAGSSSQGKFSVWFSNPNSDLDHGEEEGNRLAKITQGEFKDEATESEFVVTASDYSILHMIMHGERSPLGTYGLSFVDDAKSDGTLTADEITLLKLNARLVTMSSCETGIGDAVAGETTTSLASAFSHAGVPAVVMSQWKVNDQSTASLMVDFYGSLFKGESLPQALRFARLKFLDEVEDPILRHPHFWGAFVISGDPSPISSGSGWSWVVWLSLTGVAILVVIRFLVAKKLK